MKKFQALCVALFLGCFVYSQTGSVSSIFGTSGEAGMAEQEFRRGVQSFYRGSFNDSIILFERALSYMPDTPLILDWLGNAYFRSGLEGIAIAQWEAAAARGYGGLLLQNKLDTVRARRITGSLRQELGRYTEAGAFPAMNGAIPVFNQPVSLLSNQDGTFWAICYTSNELLRIDVNGTVLDRRRGPVNGFDRPMDILRRRDGSLLVTEYFGDRISVLDSRGEYVSSFGKKGRGLGEVIGPQYGALDSSENFFVTDFGNARVAVFDRDGAGLFTFGGQRGAFPGFKAPTGIAIISDMVYVADAATGGIYRFDQFGNYTGPLVPEGTFVRPEAMRTAGNYLIIPDTNRIFTVDVSNGAVFESGRTGSAPSRVTCAAPDANGNILAADFRGNEIFVFSPMDELVGGLFVQIERVVSENFPQVTLEVSVENRRREPVVGLQGVNFLITEEKRPAANQQFAGAANLNDLCDITVLIDRSRETLAYRSALEAAVTEIVSAMNGRGTLRVVSAGETPFTEFAGNPGVVRDFSAPALKTPVTSRAALDLAVRLAANDLVNGEKKRAIVYLTAGGLSPSAFTRYGLTDLTAYLNNNHIGFYTVMLAQGAPAEEISYISGHTEGRTYYVYRPEGLSSLVTDILNAPRGLYRLTYTSSLPTDFGRSFLPVEVEAYLLNRSGRDETGYYAPLQ
ncbi:MAG: hypothetical protein LBR23_05585 [Spirochaetaceae bacterium]|jgi:DNA-binding beta-propeller fold protein YncE|nr:hypothetical protein [Spirochaetaceae bacterium]